MADYSLTDYTSEDPSAQSYSGTDGSGYYGLDLSSSGMGLTYDGIGAGGSGSLWDTYAKEPSFFEEMGGLKGIGNLVLGGLGLYGQYQGQQDRMDLANKQLGMSDEQFAKNLELQREQLALQRELGLGNLGISQGQLDLQNNQFALSQGIDEMASKALGMQLLVNRGRMSPEQVNPWLNFMHSGRSQMFGQNSPISNAFNTNPFEGFTLGTAVSHAGPGRLLNSIQSGNPDIAQQFGSGDRRTDTGLKFMADGGIYSSAVERMAHNRIKGNQPPKAPMLRQPMQQNLRAPMPAPGSMPTMPPLPNSMALPTLPSRQAAQRQTAPLPGLPQGITDGPARTATMPRQQSVPMMPAIPQGITGGQARVAARPQKPGAAQQNALAAGQQSVPMMPAIPQGLQQGPATLRVAPPTRQRAQLGPDVMAMLQEQRFGVVPQNPMMWGQFFGGGAVQYPMMQGQRFAKGGAPRGGLGMMGSHQGLVLGETGGQEDAVNARIADGEYIFDADTVSALGDGNTIAGAKKLDAMREEIRRHKRSAPASKIPPKAKNAKSYMNGGA